jgi:hypothetical protein
MALPNSEKITSQLATLPDQALKQMAMMHKADPYILPLVISEDGRRKQMRQAAQAQMAQMQQPKVADAALAQMGALPEELGIAQLPAPNMQQMADGGIAGYDDGGVAQNAVQQGGGPAGQLAFNSEPVIRMAKGGATKMSGSELFDKALDMEGITDPKERAFLKALHQQESSGKTTAKTSNRDAQGAMQILPGTFKQVADKDMDISKPLDNMRAGIRYGKKGFDAAGGDPVLAGAYYYGGPGGMQKAAKGVAVSDPKNPNAPDTVEYGKSIAQRMTNLLPIGSAQAGIPPQKQQAAAPAPATDLASQIPGYGKPVPAAQAPSTYFGLPESETTRNVQNTISALPGIGGLLKGAAAGTGTISRVGRAVPAAATVATAPGVIADQFDAKPATQTTGYNPEKMEPVRADEFGGMPEPVQEKVVEAAKAVVPEKKGSGLSNDDYLTLGLNLLANKSRNFMTALGEAGLATVGAKKARETAETDKAYKEAQTRQVGAYADYLERGAKEKNMAFEAEKEVNDYMEKWDKNNKILALQDPTARMLEEQRIRQQIYASAGVKPIMAQQAAPAGVGDFKLVGVRG